MKNLLLGIILAIVGFLVSILIWGSDKAYFIPGGIGIILLGLSMVLSGSMVSGDRMRANYATESSEDRHSRNKMLLNMTLICAPNLILAIII
ncbi:hypothetical protein FA727_05455 [Robertmurraya kyonggiensis]|uniref:Uncharacterized protein n=1 Tax=Robertmurraya kyonggiensis TaxID=1037680 RepID=A0A4U1D993_9BACI|nr:hypothetical protein FA727_05455 [Robertmurraya kyonggiensis]